MFELVSASGFCLLWRPPLPQSPDSLWWLPYFLITGSIFLGHKGSERKEINFHLLCNCSSGVLELSCHISPPPPPSLASFETPRLPPLPSFLSPARPDRRSRAARSSDERAVRRYVPSLRYGHTRCHAPRRQVLRAGEKSGGHTVVVSCPPIVEEGGRASKSSLSSWLLLRLYIES